MSTCPKTSDPSSTYKKFSLVYHEFYNNVKNTSFSASICGQERKKISLLPPPLRQSKLFVYARPEFIVLQQCERYCLQSTFLGECSCFHALYLDKEQHKGTLPPCDLRANSSVISRRHSMLKTTFKDNDNSQRQKTTFDDT